MLETPTQHQQQLWVVRRLFRICKTFRSMAKSEPCLEQYEQQVRLMMDEEVSPAAAAWIELIVGSLRSGEMFRVTEYVR
jgi:hypothetical protein